jgi:hypothetical protein
LTNFSVILIVRFCLPFYIFSKYSLSHPNSHQTSLWYMLFKTKFLYYDFTIIHKNISTLIIISCYCVLVQYLRCFSSNVHLPPNQQPNIYCGDGEGGEYGDGDYAGADVHPPPSQMSSSALRVPPPREDNL